MTSSVILTPDQRVRVFVSSTLGELAEERVAVRRAIESLRLAPVMFELGARPHPPRSLYAAYIEQSHVFVGVYWQRYGWVAPGMQISGLEDEYVLSEGKPRLIYVKRPAPEVEGPLDALLDRVRSAGDVSYRGFETAEELERLVADDLATMLSEAYQTQVSRMPTDLRGAEHRPRVPAAPTALVGRAKELEELRELLDRERLVTLTGPGGIGKTRLALQLATEFAQSLPDGAAVVSLAPLDDPSLVASAIADSLGVREEGRDRPLDAVLDHLLERRMLLVLDNFEHLLAARPAVTALLDDAPGLTLLVTSREALRVLAEHEFPVPSLDRDDAVRLFVQRAAAVRHGFERTGSDPATLGAIVDAVEGVPLAIELAAARTRALPPEAILERLDRRLDFLAGGAADLPERQRALRNTMDWSHELLDEQEQRQFASLGVFAGSFSLSAAEAVCHEERGDGLGVLDGLASLVDKSLLRAEASEREPRFRMISIVREYALEKLGSGEEPAELGRRHAAFYRDHSQSLRPALRGPEQGQWVDWLGRGTGTGDIDNLRASMRWYLDFREPDGVASIVWSMWLLGWISGRLDECRRWARAALDIAGPLSREGRGRLLTVAGLFEMWQGQYETSIASLREAVGLAREIDDVDILANALLGLSLASSFLGGTPLARAEVEEAHTLFQTTDDRWGRAASCSALTWFLVAEEDFDEGGPAFEGALALAEELADDVNRAMIEVNVAEYRLHRGEHDEACRLLAAALTRYRALRALYPSSYAVDAVARFAATTGRCEIGAMLIGAADRMRETIGVPVEGAHSARRQTLVDHLRAALGEEQFDAAVGGGRALAFEQAIEVASEAIAAA